MHAQTHAQDARERISAVALAATARNLQFLKLIDATIDAVSANTEHVRICATDISCRMDRLKGEFTGIVVPDEARFVKDLCQVIETAQRIHRDAVKRRESAHFDQMLRPDDGVTDVYADLIHAAENLFNIASECKEWIETNNALLEPATHGPCRSANELIAALNAD